MEVDIDLNNHKINIPQFITGYYKKSEHPKRIFLNGENPNKSSSNNTLELPFE